MLDSGISETAQSHHRDGEEEQREPEQHREHREIAAASAPLALARLHGRAHPRISRSTARAVNSTNKYQSE